MRLRVKTLAIAQNCFAICGAFMLGFSFSQKFHYVAIFGSPIEIVKRIKKSGADDRT